MAHVSINHTCRIATATMSGSSSARVLARLLESSLSGQTDKYLQSEFMAALPALYGPHVGSPFTAAPELTNITLPPGSLLRKAGREALRSIIPALRTNPSM